MGTKPLRCLYAASEVAGFAKTGGLADVAASLPRALAARGIDCAVIMPLYRSVRAAHKNLKRTGLSFEVPIGPRLVKGGLWRGTLPDGAVPIFFIEQPEYFERDDPATGQGLYQYVGPDGRRVDYPDNAQRFIFFSRAILEVLPLLGFWPDVIHINDWQTGLVPVYLRELYEEKVSGGVVSGEWSQQAPPTTHHSPLTTHNATQYRRIRTL